MLRDSFAPLVAVRLAPGRRRTFSLPGGIYASRWTSLPDDEGQCRIVKGILRALTAESPISSVRSTLLSAREDAIDASGISEDAPWVV